MVGILNCISMRRWAEQIKKLTCGVVWSTSYAVPHIAVKFPKDQKIKEQNYTGKGMFLPTSI